MLSACIDECSNWNEVETIELFREHIFPITFNETDVRIKNKIPRWQNAMAEYVESMERDCDKYAYSRVNSWRAKYRNADTQHFTEVIADGIQYQEAWEKEQEQLMKTVRGQLMKYPSCVFEIMTPDGKARLSPNDIKMLLSGETNTVVIDECNYAAFELLDQEVLEMQVDIFDDSRIRMKTGGYEEPDFELTM